MKKQLAIVSTLIILAVLAFLIMSCAPGTQNGNVAQNQNANINANSNLMTSDLPSDPEICSMSNMNDKREMLIAKLKEKIEKQDKNIEKQFKGEPPYPPNFKYDFVIPSPSSSEIYLIFEGRVSGDTKFQKIVDFIEDFVKKTCTQKVYFVPPGTLPMTAEKITNLRNEGFEWYACDYPMVPCSNGSCDYPDNCSRLTEANTPNRPTNTNSGTNANVNVNSNANRAP